MRSTVATEWPRMRVICMILQDRPRFLIYRRSHARTCQTKISQEPGQRWLVYALFGTELLDSSAGTHQTKNERVGSTHSLLFNEVIKHRENGWHWSGSSVRRGRECLCQATTTCTRQRHVLPVHVEDVFGSKKSDECLPSICLRVVEVNSLA